MSAIVSLIHVMLSLYSTTIVIVSCAADVSSASHKLAATSNTSLALALEALVSLLGMIKVLPKDDTSVNG